MKGREPWAREHSVPFPSRFLSPLLLLWSEGSGSYLDPAPRPRVSTAAISNFVLKILGISCPSRSLLSFDCPQRLAPRNGRLCMHFGPGFQSPIVLMNYIRLMSSYDKIDRIF